MPYEYKVPGVDLNKFQKYALQGCYQSKQSDKNYGQDYAYYLLGKFQYLNYVVMEKRSALTETTLEKIAQDVQKISEKNAKDDPELHGENRYTPENRTALNKARKPLIEYRIALKNLCNCCMKMDVDKNIMLGNSMPDEKKSLLGVIQYDEFNCWRDGLLNELAQWEQKANSVGGHKAVSEDFNCMACASGEEKHLAGSAFLSQEKVELVRLLSCEFEEIQSDWEEAGWDLYADVNEFGMQPGGGIYRCKTTTDISACLQKGATEKLTREGFDVDVSSITDNNYGKVPPLKPGYHRMFLMYQMENEMIGEEMGNCDYHWASQEGGRWLDKPGKSWILNEEEGRNPTQMNPSDTYQQSVGGKFYRPAGVDTPEAKLPCGPQRNPDDKSLSDLSSVEFSKKTPALPVAYIDISDKDRLLKKYKLLQDQDSSKAAQWMKQMQDIVAHSSNNRVTAEAFKKSKTIRYQIFAKLGLAFVQNKELTADELNTATKALQEEQKEKPKLQMMLQKLLPEQANIPNYVQKIGSLIGEYKDDTNPALVTPLASIIETPSASKMK